MLVVVGIFGVLMMLALASVHKVRATADRARCSNQLRQLTLALIRYHDEHSRLPMGVTPNEPEYDYPYMTWLNRLLPYLDQDGLWRQAVEDYRQDRNPIRGPAHRGMGTPVSLFVCPSDPRGAGPHTTRRDRVVGCTSYLGVLGTDHVKSEGVLWGGTSRRLGDVADGLSHTLMLGERPPSFDFWFGWWYAGFGMNGTGALDAMLGVREVKSPKYYGGHCPRGPYRFEPGKVDDPCAAYHFWSFHPGGAHFAMCDGSVRFLPYSADAVLPALATRAGGESQSLP